MKTRLTAMAVFSAASAGVAGAPLPAGLICLLLPAIAVLIGPRLSLRVSGQVAATFACAFCAIFLASSWGADRPDRYDITTLSERELLVWLPLITIAGLRSLLLAPRFGAQLTLTLALLSMCAGGGALTGVSFPVFATAFCILRAFALNASDLDQAAAPWDRFRTTAVVGTAVFTAGLCATSSAYLPRVQAAVLSELYARMDRHRVGFSGQLELGDLEGLLNDDRVVLRVRGSNEPALLRGAVFTDYADGRWSTVPAHAPSPIFRTAVKRPAGDDWLELEFARRPERYFLPAGSYDVTTSDASYTRDAYAIASPPTGSYAKRIWFHVGQQHEVAAPSARDLRLPPAIETDLVAMARNWGTLEGSAAARLTRLQQRLQSDYTYSLATTRESGADPVIDFLQHNPEGHCEYFASAMALLGRASAIPSRLVSGYRATEHSRFGYQIVRRRHAHSWVEMWVEGRWLVVDPTPAAGVSAGEPLTTPWFSAVLDAARTTWLAADDWLVERSSFELLFALLVLLGLLVGIRTYRARQSRGPLAQRPDGPLLPGFSMLMTQLESRGLERAPSETVGRFAARLQADVRLNEPQRRRLAESLDRYCAHVYGQQGDAKEVDAALRRASQELR